MPQPHLFCLGNEISHRLLALFAFNNYDSAYQSCQWRTLLSLFFPLKVTCPKQIDKKQPQLDYQVLNNGQRTNLYSKPKRRLKYGFPIIITSDTTHFFNTFIVETTPLNLFQHPANTNYMISHKFSKTVDPQTCCSPEKA